MITYQIEPAHLHAHLFQVTLIIPKPSAQQQLSLPVWIPGSYLVREFARHLSSLHAEQAGRALVVQQLDKATWTVSCAGRGALRVSYSVYAFDKSVRAAFLDAQRGFFNGTSLCLRAKGFENDAHRLELRGLPKGWQVATAMKPVKVNAQGAGVYESADYDELVDHPFELGTFWRGQFHVGRVVHEVVVTGALPGFDGERLLRDSRQICATQIQFWHGGASQGKGRGPQSAPPFKRYVFLLNAVEEGRGGLEHRASTALIAPRRDLPQRGQPGQSDGYVSLLGLISHEYFHTWNVKRLRPAELARYDYSQENYTELLWFFEGFTSYYDDLLLVRSGLIEVSQYLKLVATTLSSVLGQPGRHVQTVAQASFDAWVKYYRADENSPNTTISYYAKGSLVALALDLTLRQAGTGSLDAVMRELWRTSQGGPISQADIAAALHQISGRSFERELSAWVHSTADLAWRQLLAGAGVQWTQEAATVAQRLGLRVSESALTGVRITHVLQGGAVEQAGLAVGDELLAVQGWRVRRLEDALPLLPPDQAVPVLVAREQRVLTLVVTLPSSTAVTGSGVTLTLTPNPSAAVAALQAQWFTGPQPKVDG